MSETLRKYGAKYNTTFCSFCGLSTDSKPTGMYEGVYIANGSEFIEMDTDKKYLYDAASQTWNVASSGGGGGGGSATLIEKSITANGEYTATSDNADGYSKVTVDVSDVKFKRLETQVLVTNNGTNLIKYVTFIMPYTDKKYAVPASVESGITFTLALPAESIQLQFTNGQVAFTPDESFTGFTYKGGGVDINMSGDSITNGDGKIYIATWEYIPSPTRSNVNITITKMGNYKWNVT